MPLLIMVIYFLFFNSTGNAASSENQAIINKIIRESIARYPGSCPCPYSKTVRGYRCGKRSAYSKPGGYSPLCYKSDVTSRQIQAYRKRHKH